MRRENQNIWHSQPTPIVDIIFVIVVAVVGLGSQITGSNHALGCKTDENIPCQPGYSRKWIVLALYTEY